MPVQDKTREVVGVVIDGVVSASSMDTQVIGPDPIPNRAKVKITLFGASEVGTGDGKASAVALQFGASGTWETIRGVGLVSMAFECSPNRTIVGDGSKKLRVVRQNNSTDQKQIVCWVEGYKL